MKSRYWKQIAIKQGILIFAFLFLSVSGGSQNNILKISPLKMFTLQRMNFGYERAINKKVFLLGEYQLWRVNKKDIDGEGALVNFSPPGPDKTYTNDGSRFLLGFRVYETLTKMKKIEDPNFQRRFKFYYGLSGFSGFHEITRTHHAYWYHPFLLGSVDISSPYSHFISKKSGEINLISSGFLLDVGFQFIFIKSIVFEFGLKGGRSWTNTGQDTFVIYPENPDDGTHVSRIQPAISGYFIEPTLNFGFTF